MPSQRRAVRAVEDVGREGQEAGVVEGEVMLLKPVVGEERRRKRRRRLLPSSNNFVHMCIYSRRRFG